MNRKQFMISQGATCTNWTWSWSFINEKEKIIFFGAWDKQPNGNRTIILDERWVNDYRGWKSNGYKESLEHIRLIEEEGYQLKIFPIIYSDKKLDKNGIGSAKIERVIEKLESKLLLKKGKSWCAVEPEDGTYPPEEIEYNKDYEEGTRNKILVNAYERNTAARRECIEHYGYKCCVCSFDFEKVYGEIGKDFIHVHHLVPLSSIGKKYRLDPIKDLRPVCPNCHAIIHRGNKVMTIEELKKLLNNKTNPNK